jgi:hypothetical protein
MIYLKYYSQLFENINTLSIEQKSLLNRGIWGRGSRWKINKDTGLVDVVGNFNIGQDTRLKDLRGLRFGLVDGDFIIDNTNIGSLEGSPKRVNGDFDFSISLVGSLEGSPRYIGGDFIGSINYIEFLDGCPEIIKGSLFLSRNRLKNLSGLTKNIGYSLDVSNNVLNSLEGCPEKIEGNFNCSDNRNLENLVGGPVEVDGDYRCERNFNLKSLEGAPKYVDGYFILDNDKKFKWTPEGKFKFILKNRDYSKLITPTIEFEDMVECIKKNPTFLSLVNDLDTDLYERIIKKLGWDKIGKDLLKLISQGLI